MNTPIRSQRLIGLFAEDAISLGNGLTATLGLRWESWKAQKGFLEDDGNRVDYASRSDHAWSPKVALSWRPDKMTEIVASAAWATRFPTIGELYQAGLVSYGPNVGQIDLGGFDPNLKPEKGIDLQLTASRRFGNVKVTLSGYRQAVDDTLFSQVLLVPSAADPDVIVSQSLITNIGEVETWGVDFIVAAEDFIVPGLDLDANLSWIDAKITKNPLNPNSRACLNGVPMLRCVTACRLSSILRRMSGTRIRRNAISRTPATRAVIPSIASRPLPSST